MRRAAKRCRGRRLWRDIQTAAGASAAEQVGVQDSVQAGAPKYVFLLSGMG